MSSKTTQPTELEIAEFNFKAEMERARLLLEIASTTDTIAYGGSKAAERVRDGALERLARILHPAMQIITELETPVNNDGTVEKKLDD